MFKKITAFAVMAVLCLCFAAFGQSGGAVEVTAKGIQVGQMVPDVVLSGLHNYKGKDGKVVSSAKLSDFRGKLLILDFWATWCSPCLAMIPRMDSLQRVFGDKVQFLSVTYQSDREVLPFMEKLEKRAGRRYSLPMVTDDKVLRGLFPHVYLPHYVWIDSDGRLGAITSYSEVTADGIRSFLGKERDLVRKVDRNVAYDAKRPLLINGNGGGPDGLRYHAMLTGFLDGLSQGYSISSVSDPKGRKVTARNQSILRLFALAHGGDKLYFGPNRILLNTSQEHLFRSGRNLKGEPLREWMADGHAFCYEVQVQPGHGHRVFELMKRDLELNFPMFQVAKVRQPTKCLVLVRTSRDEKFASRGGSTLNHFTPIGCKLVNSNFSVLTSRLEMLYLQKSYPLVDGTGYTGNIDLELDASLSNVDAINLALGRYGLKLEERLVETELLSVNDSVDFAKPREGGERK